jgi:ABC-type polysaccharide/polyol phosphate export permease
LTASAEITIIQTDLQIKSEGGSRDINIVAMFRSNLFLFQELVKRDFKRRYKRTLLGMLWSMVSPLAQLLVMNLIFVNFFGNTTPHFTVYLFSGILLYGYFNESTNAGMSSLEANAGIITSVRVPKWLFLLSKNVSGMLNVALAMLVFLLVCIIDGIRFHPGMLMILYAITFLTLFNIGVGFILSALRVFFHDIEYLYNILLLLLMYASAIFYDIDGFPPKVQLVFHLNPVFCFIKYFRYIVLDGVIPSFRLHALCAGYAFFALLLGGFIYRKYNYKFLYYM